MVKKKYGMALFLVLTVASLLTMMTLAMLGNHQSNFAILADSINLRQAQLAASTGVEFAKYKLELDRNYAKTPITLTTSTWGEVSIREKDMTIEGTWVNSSPVRSFTVNVTNYLNKDGGSADRPSKNAVRINTVGVCGNFKLSTEVILAEAPLYDSAACSDGKMDLSQVTKWYVDSKDNLRNWVRSNTEVDTPDFLAGKTLEFQNATCPSPGVVWSKGNIFIGDPANKNDVLSVAKRTPPVTASDIKDKTKGQMAPFSSLNYNIYDLKLEDLKKPGSDQDVPAGNYTITKFESTYVDEHWERDWDGWSWGSGWHKVGETNGSKIFKDLVYTAPDTTKKHYMYDETPLPQNGSTDIDYWHRTVRRDVNTPPGTTQLFPSTGSVVNISRMGGAPSDNLNFDFKTYNFNAANNATLNVTGGDLNIKSDAPLPADDGNKTPRVVFHDTTTAPGKPGFLVGGKNVSLEGSVIGKGGVAATNDLTLAANSNLSVDKSTQLVLWSGNNMTFDVAGGQDMTFNGLVYCKNSVALKFNGGDGSHLLNSLTTNGALVAQTGNISMMNATTVNMTYDPAYLQLFTNGLPGGTARFVQVSFKIKE